MRHKITYGLIFLGMASFCAYTAFYWITASLREASTAAFAKPEVVKRLEQEFDGAPHPGQERTEMTAEQRFEAYAQLAKRVREIVPDSFMFRVPPPPDTQARLEAVLAEHPDLLDQIRATLRMGGPISRLDFSKGALGPHGSISGRLLPCATLLIAHANRSAREGDLDAAFEDLLLSLSLGELMSGESLLASQWTSQRVYTLTLEAMQPLLTANGIDAARAAQALEQLASASHREIFRESLEVQNFLIGTFYDDIDGLNTHDFMQRYMQGDADEVGTTAVVWLIQSPVGAPWTNMGAAANADVCCRMHVLTDRPYRESLPAAAQLIEDQFENWQYRYLGGFFSANQPGALAEQALHETRVEIARVAIALEVHYAENGFYPESLDGIGPYFGGRIPNDPLSGTPFEYHTDGTSFELLSSGATHLANVLQQLVPHEDLDVRWDGQHKERARELASAASKRLVLQWRVNR